MVVSNREENIQIDKNIDENHFFPRSEARSPPFSMACSCATVPICAKLPMIILYVNRNNDESENLHVNRRLLD